MPAKKKGKKGKKGKKKARAQSADVCESADFGRESACDILDQEPMSLNKLLDFDISSLKKFRR
jgi:hypothetical protein